MTRRTRPSFEMPMIAWSCNPTWSTGPLIIARATSGYGSFVTCRSVRPEFADIVPQIIAHMSQYIRDIAWMAYTDFHWPHETRFRRRKA